MRLSTGAATYSTSGISATPTSRPKTPEAAAVTAHAAAPGAGRNRVSEGLGNRMDGVPDLGCPVLFQVVDDDPAADPHHRGRSDDAK